MMNFHAYDHNISNCIFCTHRCTCSLFENASLVTLPLDPTVTLRVCTKLHAYINYFAYSIKKMCQICILCRQDFWRNILLNVLFFLQKLADSVKTTRGKTLKEKVPWGSVYVYHCLRCLKRSFWFLKVGSHVLFYMLHGYMYFFSKGGFETWWLWCCWDILVTPASTQVNWFVNSS